MFAGQVRSSSQAAMGAVRPSGLVWFLALAALGFACAATLSAQAQTLTTLYSFSGPPDGFNPYAPLIRDTVGNLYGTTETGGDSTNCPGGCGTVFELSSNGVETILHSFRNTARYGGTSDGAALYAGLVRDAAGNFYGTTYGGGVYNFGSVFKLNKEGKERALLYSFTGGADGSRSQAGLILDSAGNVYGTTVYGGVGPCVDLYGQLGCGTVFMVTPAGVETVLYSFMGGADGAYPIAGLARDGVGNFYGTTEDGGAANCTDYNGQGCGTVFKLTSAGVETVLHSFAGSPTDGERPSAVIMGAGGNLYGTTFIGGTSNDGTVFEMTPTGTEKLLHSFGGYAGDGSFPYAGLVADGGSFYGTTQLGGGCCGTIFKMSKAGVESVVYSFAGATGGCLPSAALISDGAGNFYGTTSNCGNVDGAGTVFKFTP
jgi:uncharacterized repeat protein (TIGR03803 family)